MGCPSCAAKYAALKASRAKSQDPSAPQLVKPKRKYGVIKANREKHPTPIIPTEGVDKGTLAPNPVTNIDPTTGIPVETIKYGTQPGGKDLKEPDAGAAKETVGPPEVASVK